MVIINRGTKDCYSSKYPAFHLLKRLLNWPQLRREGQINPRTLPVSAFFKPYLAGKLGKLVTIAQGIFPVSSHRQTFNIVRHTYTQKFIPEIMENVLRKEQIHAPNVFLSTVCHHLGTHSFNQFLGVYVPGPCCLWHLQEEAIPPVECQRWVDRG